MARDRSVTKGKREESKVDPYVAAFVKAANRPKFARQVETFTLMVDVLSLLNDTLSRLQRDTMRVSLPQRCKQWLQDKGCRLPKVARAQPNLILTKETNNDK